MIQPSIYYLKQNGWIQIRRGGQSLWKNVVLAPEGVPLPRAKRLEHTRTVEKIEAFIFGKPVVKSQLKGVAEKWEKVVKAIK